MLLLMAHAPDANADTSVMHCEGVVCAPGPEAAASRVPWSRTLFNNTCRDLLAIAAEMLNGG
jgi:hypothetical protein